jgi:hypothetical protein
MTSSRGKQVKSDMSNEEKPTSPGLCPKCRAIIANEPSCTGMWSGAKANGSLAGGGILTTVCGKCGSALQAYNDVYDDCGEVMVNYEFDPSQLYWHSDETQSAS